MKTKLINFFREPGRIILLSGFIVGIILSYLFLDWAGVFLPPSESDFSELHKQEEIILEDFEKVYSFENATIYPQEEEIIVKLVSEESSNFILKMTFTKQKEFVSSEEISEKVGYSTYPINPIIDKLQPFIYFVTIGILLGFLVAVLVKAIYEKLKK